MAIRVKLAPMSSLTKGSDPTWSYQQSSTRHAFPVSCLVFGFQSNALLPLQSKRATRGIGSVNTTLHSLGFTRLVWVVLCSFSLNSKRIFKRPPSVGGCRGLRQPEAIKSNGELGCRTLSAVLSWRTASTHECQCHLRNYTCAVKGKQK